MAEAIGNALLANATQAILIGRTIEKRVLGLDIAQCDGNIVWIRTESDFRCCGVTSGHFHTFFTSHAQKSQCGGNSRLTPSCTRRVLATVMSLS